MHPVKGSLLVVDDMAHNRDLLCRRLALLGYTVTAAAGGVQALRWVEQRRFDLVLLDVNMPDINGLEVLKILRQTYSPRVLPVIMVTAKPQSEHMVEALNLGANDYVTQPLDSPVLLARVPALRGPVPHRR